MRIVQQFRQSNLQFPLTFFACMAILMAGYYALPSSFIEGVIVRYFAVLPGGYLLDWLTPGHAVTVDNNRIVSDIARLNILKGCEGTETLLILYSAVIAVLRPAPMTLYGLILGTFLVFILNQLRIISLFFIAAYEKSLFELTHGFLAPILIIAIAGLFFIFWLKWTASDNSLIQPTSNDIE
jgi:exosortase family protein XrtM